MPTALEAFEQQNIIKHVVKTSCLYAFYATSTSKHDVCTRKTYSVYHQYTSSSGHGMQGNFVTDVTECHTMPIYNARFYSDYCYSCNLNCNLGIARNLSRSFAAIEDLWCNTISWKCTLSMKICLPKRNVFWRWKRAVFDETCLQIKML